MTTTTREKRSEQRVAADDFSRSGALKEVKDGGQNGAPFDSASAYGGQNAAPPSIGGLSSVRFPSSTTIDSVNNNNNNSMDRVKSQKSEIEVIPAPPKSKKRGRPTLAAKQEAAAAAAAAEAAAKKLRDEVSSPLAATNNNNIHPFRDAVGASSEPSSWHQQQHQQMQGMQHQNRDVAQSRSKAEQDFMGQQQSLRQRREEEEQSHPMSQHIHKKPDLYGKGLSGAVQEQQQQHFEENSPTSRDEDEDMSGS